MLDGRHICRSESPSGDHYPEQHIVYHHRPAFLSRVRLWAIPSSSLFVTKVYKKGRFRFFLRANLAFPISLCG